MRHTYMQLHARLGLDGITGNTPMTGPNQATTAFMADVLQNPGPPRPNWELPPCPAGSQGILLLWGEYAGIYTVSGTAAQELVAALPVGGPECVPYAGSLARMLLHQGGSKGCKLGSRADQQLWCLQKLFGQPPHTGD